MPTRAQPDLGPAAALAAEHSQGTTTAWLQALQMLTHPCPVPCSSAAVSHSMQRDAAALAPRSCISATQCFHRALSNQVHHARGALLVPAEGS